MNIQVEFMRRFRFKEVFSLHVPFFLQAFWCPEGVPIVIHICIYRMIYSTQKYRLDWYTIMYTYDKYIKCTLSMGVLCLVKLNGDFTTCLFNRRVTSGVQLPQSILRKGKAHPKHGDGPVLKPKEEQGTRTYLFSSPHGYWLSKKLESIATTVDTLCYVTNISWKSYRLGWIET